MQSEEITMSLSSDRDNRFRMLSKISLVCLVLALGSKSMDLDFGLRPNPLHFLQGALLGISVAGLLHALWHFHRRPRPLNEAKDPRSTRSSELQARIALASQQRSGRELLIDPIESDPLMAEKIRDAAAEAKQAVELSGYVGRGSCHVIWKKQAEILAERHGITWFSPSEMNPGVIFD